MYNESLDLQLIVKRTTGVICDLSPRPSEIYGRRWVKIWITFGIGMEQSSMVIGDIYPDVI